MTKSSVTVLCEEHGLPRRTVVCRHLVSGAGVGFFTAADDDPENPWPGAWCAECEAILTEDRGWSERAREFARVTLVCDRCYEAARQLNPD